MDDRDGMKDRGRSLEEEWARQWAREAVERLRARRDENEECRRLAEATGIRSPELVRRIRELGLDAESVSLLFLVPMVGIAGADGAVSHAERARVKELAHQGGVARGSYAAAMLDGWLIDPPAGEELDRMLAVRRDLVAALPQDQADAICSRTLAALEHVGRASGGLFGIGTISRAERTFMAKVAQSI